MLNLILILVIGGLIGWLASKVMGTDPEQGIILNVVVGIVGALLGGFLAGLLGIGGGSIIGGDFNFLALLIAFLGASLLIWIVKMVRGRT